MNSITTHVLDTALGQPAAGVSVILERRESDGGWVRLGTGLTDADGRLRTLLPEGTALRPGVHRLVFATGEYARARGEAAFYPEVPIVFDVRDAAQHYHVPLLLAPFGYSTYRGS